MPRSSPVTRSHRLNAKPYKPHKAHRDAQTKPYQSTTPTILLVDDDASVLESLRRVLATEGWLIITAANGEEALERLAERQPDLMITDLCMIGVSGWDLLFHEKLQRPNLPIFVITALPPTSAKGADHFATNFFQKPLDLEVMVATIRRHFRETQSIQPS